MSATPDFHRPAFGAALRRLQGPRRFIQVLAGPRQVGKTTLARQLIAAADRPSHYASADDVAPADRVWITSQWEVGRLRAAEGGRRGALLVLDEVQKIAGWSDTVERLWDEDTAAGSTLRVMLLGSSPLLVHRGLTESLAGRFELIRMSHWTHAEMRDAFGWDLDTSIHFGGYPGAAPLIDDEARWRAYILDSLVETTVSRDILLQSRIDKPALLRRLFMLACRYSGQILSYTKMLGQLHDAGNTTTLAHYLDLLAGAGMVTGLQKHSGGTPRARASSPKLQVMNTALMTAVSGRTFQEARSDPEWWGRVVESAAGAHLLATASPETALEYWRERNQEVDFVLASPGRTAAFEIASGAQKDALPGLAAFAERFDTRRTLFIGAQGIPLEDFFARPAEDWLKR